MPLVVSVFASDDTEVVGAFEKQATEGDAFRFVSAEPGKESLLNLEERTASATVSGVLVYTFDAGFNYLVGLNQIQVAIVLANGLEFPITRLGTLVTARARDTWPAAQIDPALTSTVYWSEDTSSTIKLYNVTEGATSFLGHLVRAVRIWSPHTATPGELTNRVTISNQGDNVAIELLGSGDGIRLRSRNGVTYTVRIGDNGTFIVEPS